MQRKQFGEPPILLYHKAYARRHRDLRVDAEKISKNRLLDLAAFLEHQVLLDEMTTYVARKQFIDEFPKTNTTAGCICASNSCNMVCKMSVLNLIKRKEDYV